MNKLKVTISEDQTEEWVESLTAIAEDNEKHERSALYYLVSAAECSYNIVKMGEKVLKEKEYPKDINCFCGCNLYFAHINKIKMNPRWLSDKDKEVDELYSMMIQALELFDKFDENPKFVNPNIQVQKFIFSQYEKLTEYVLEKEGLREKFLNTEKKHHDALIRFEMDLGKYSSEVVNFFLDYYIYKRLVL